MCRYIFFICAIACPRTTYIRFPFNFIDKIDTSHIFSWKYNLLKRQNNVTKVEGELKGCPLCCPTSAFKSLLYLHNSPKYYGVLDNQLGLIITMRHKQMECLLLLGSIQFLVLLNSVRAKLLMRIRFGRGKPDFCGLHTKPS